MNETTFRRLTNSEVRANAILWLPSISAFDAFPEAFGTFCEDMPDDLGSPLYVGLPQLVRFADDDEYPKPMAVAEALIGMPGFIVQAASPVREYHSKTMWSSSWGYYNTAWLYAATEREIASVIANWADARHAKQWAEYVAITKATSP